jgi:group I intron endonuclease
MKLIINKKIGLSGIYQIKNLKNNKFYYGQSNNIPRRYRQHLNDLVKNKHSNIHLQNAFNIDGTDNFIMNVIKYEIKNLNKFEQMLLDSFVGKSNCYNLSKNADTPPSFIGKKHTEEWKKIMAERIKGERHPMFGKRGILSPTFNRKHTSKEKEKMKYAHKNIKSVGQFSKTGELINIYKSIREAERETNIQSSAISLCCRKIKRFKSAGNYLWQYREDFA